MITQKQINKYIKDIKKELLYGTKESRQFLTGLRQSVADFAEENPNAEMAEVTEQFGKPEDIAATFFEQYSKESIKKKVNIRRVVVVAAVMVVFTVLASLIIALIDGHIAGNGNIIISPVEEIELVNGTTAPVSPNTDSINVQG